ncbi:MAG: hypothetical protein FWD82_09615 [Defluviitaleaceae bacterium]|nr:hypothetical protein [Defluviitaleaceae bacterium]
MELFKTITPIHEIVMPTVHICCSISTMNVQLVDMSSWYIGNPTWVMRCLHCNTIHRWL